MSVFTGAERVFSGTQLLLFCHKRRFKPSNRRAIDTPRLQHSCCWGCSLRPRRPLLLISHPAWWINKNNFKIRSSSWSMSVKVKQLVFATTHVIRKFMILMLAKISFFYWHKNDEQEIRHFKQTIEHCDGSHFLFEFEIAQKLKAICLLRLIDGKDSSRT